MASIFEMAPQVNKSNETSPVPWCFKHVLTAYVWKGWINETLLLEKEAKRGYNLESPTCQAPFPLTTFDFVGQTNQRVILCSIRTPRLPMRARATKGIPTGLVITSFVQCSLQWWKMKQRALGWALVPGPKMTRCQIRSYDRLLVYPSPKTLFLFLFFFGTAFHDTDRRINWKEHWGRVYFMHWWRCFISYDPQENKALS